MTAAPPPAAHRRIFVEMVGAIVICAIVAVVFLAMNGKTSGVEAVGAIGSFALGSLCSLARP